MTDTDTKMAAIYLSMLSRKSPEERLKMACAMFDFSKKLVIGSLRPQNLSPAEMRREIFLRFYGDDFGPERQRRILEHLSDS